MFFLFKLDKKGIIFKKQNLYKMSDRYDSIWVACKRCGNKAKYFKYELSLSGTVHCGECRQQICFCCKKDCSEKLGNKMTMFSDAVICETCYDEKKDDIAACTKCQSFIWTFAHGSPCEECGDFYCDDCINWFFEQSFCDYHYEEKKKDCNHKDPSKVCFNASLNTIQDCEQYLFTCENCGESIPVNKDDKEFIDKFESFKVNNPIEKEIEWYIDRQNQNTKKKKQKRK